MMDEKDLQEHWDNIALVSKLKKPAESGIKSLKEDVKINEILEVYVPIYESRLVGPRKKIKLLRIDAVRKKVL